MQGTIRLPKIPNDETSTTKVVEYITKGFDRSECTAAVFLDIQKASDRVLKQGLIHKLIMYKTPPNLVQLLNSYLDDRKLFVRIGNSSSESKTMKAGIPQGGKSRPFFTPSM
ncbi:hypothetical protein AVEN_30426-1 [Araneus ventricosus]|uniref:Reverse transcriptase domain-containing protein n=1 Tax=Araneus ventricosus TaxID=182803 RepID=A0A4Y2WZA5_ARAVE|nr:hypothetical protein AVEN_30426-1 [Araneus ventricosus]